MMCSGCCTDPAKQPICSPSALGLFRDTVPLGYMQGASSASQHQVPDQTRPDQEATVLLQPIALRPHHRPQAPVDAAPTSTVPLSLRHEPYITGRHTSSRLSTRPFSLYIPITSRRLSFFQPHLFAANLCCVIPRRRFTATRKAQLLNTTCGTTIPSLLQLPT